MGNMIRKNRKYIVLLIDIFAWCFNYAISYGLIYNLYGFDIISNSTFFKSLLILNVLYVAILFARDFYNTIWRYLRIRDIFTIILSVTVVNVVLFFICDILSLYVNTKVFIINTLATICTLIFTRTFYYLLSSALEQRRGVKDKLDKKRLLIIGGGEASVILLSELNQNRRNEYLPVGIIDDSPEKLGRKILGVKVLGNTSQIKEIYQSKDIEAIIFSIVNIAGESKKQILNECMDLCKDVKVIPSIYNVVVSSNQVLPYLKDVDAEDLLGREPIDISKDKNLNYVKNKVVLVTGGGGSIGSELCQQIASLSPKKLIILDIYENNVYELEQKLKYQYEDKLDFNVEIASVREEEKINAIFEMYSPQVVFHAAAHKHVPLMETNPEEAVKNNIGGTLNVLKAADKYEVERMIVISTDKAVNPTNAMGATKRVCEILMRTFAKESKTKFAAVRFGNVLGSNGSVVPLFKKQLSQGGPLTVTHPEITRYFMTTTEAVSLVIAAGSIVNGGEIFVLDMGTPVKIKDLAENMIRLAGKVPYRDIDIEYIGLRPGEKLYEELLMDINGLDNTKYDKIFIEPFVGYDVELVKKQLDRLFNIVKTNDKLAIKQGLKEIVPEYVEKNLQQQEKE